MKIFVVNAGSSTLKYQVLDMENETVICKGICERIGAKDGSLGTITHKLPDGRKIYDEVPMPTHAEAFVEVIKEMTEGELKVLDSFDEIAAIGHRIVQGGSIFKDSCLVTKKVRDDIAELGELAPLHNPAHVLAIDACTEIVGDRIPQVAVFDTSFHQTLEPRAYMYGLPYEYYEKYKIRRYGAHGTSHKYVSDRLAEMTGRDKKDMKIITCHLGSGCSISAIKDGKCFDTSMGFTPLDGFMMGTRCGTMDPSVLTFIAKKENLTPDDINTICNKKSGVLGVSGITDDNRDLVDLSAAGNERAKLALDMQTYQIIKFIGSYIAAMDGVDAIVFAGGIGENNPELRQNIIDNFHYLGIKLDDAKNHTRGEEIKISTEDSGVEVYIIPTNEELAIARDTERIVGEMK